MNKVGFLAILALILVIACSQQGNNPTSSEQIWWESPDPDATWITFTSSCDSRVVPTQQAADSVCMARGYYKSTGYEEEGCYVGGEKRIYMSRVACSLD